jgi:imidazoleglycerol-phosphate dehydratase
MITVTRQSSETNVRVSVGKDAAPARISTTVPFLDHMLATLARYGGFALEVQATGDLRHHVIEDVAIALGRGIAALAPAACARFGDRTIPMDDALVQCVVDIGGRAFYRGPIPSSLYDHFMRSFAENAGATVHFRVVRGKDRHHVIEAAFKALGLALRDALRDSGEGAVFSTKGAVTLEVQ